MKLAEALLLRSEHRAKVDQLESRICNNAKVQEDMKPDEDPNQLLKELLTLHDNMATLIQQINVTNQTTMINDDLSVTDAIVLRESCRRKMEALHRVYDSASQRDFRLTRTEIKMNVVINLSDIQKKIDELSKEIRILDTTIQEKNWLTDLID
ncbi:MAG: DIP1984 family protein [Erysipelothrix sp.]|nr:DIP1984 family protein [Erysipelothrix sp.]